MNFRFLPERDPTLVNHSDPIREYNLLKQEIDYAIQNVLLSGVYVQDLETATLEKEFAAFCGVRYAINTVSGGMALLVGLRALGIGPGDEVITAPYTDIATVMSIINAGAKVVFADVEEDTLTLDPDRVEIQLSDNTHAILPVHIHGQVAEMDPLRQLAERHDLVLLEDAALAAGATYRGRRTGSLGHAGAFSFAPGKVFGGIGWGGMLTTDDPEVATRARQLAGYGPTECELETPDCLEGYSAQMSGLQAADLRIKLRHLENWVNRRRAIASNYDEVCDRLGIRRLQPRPWTEPSYRVYVIFLEGRVQAIQRFKDMGVKALPYYPIPLHLRPSFTKLGYKRGDFPVAEKVTEELICLPVHPHLTDEEVGKVVKALEAIG